MCVWCALGAVRRIIYFLTNGRDGVWPRLADVGLRAFLSGSDGGAAGTFLSYWPAADDYRRRCLRRLHRGSHVESERIEKHDDDDKNNLLLLF